MQMLTIIGQNPTAKQSGWQKTGLKVITGVIDQMWLKGTSRDWCWLVLGKNNFGTVDVLLGASWVISPDQKQIVFSTKHENEHSNIATHVLWSVAMSADKFGYSFSCLYILLKLTLVYNMWPGSSMGVILGCRRSQYQNPAQTPNLSKTLSASSKSLNKVK